MHATIRLYTAKELSAMTPEQLKQERDYWQRAAERYRNAGLYELARDVEGETVRALDDEIRMRTPRTGTACRLYGIPFPTAEQMEFVGRYLCALPPVAMDDVFRSLGSEG